MDKVARKEEEEGGEERTKTFYLARVREPRLRGGHTGGEKNRGTAQTEARDKRNLQANTDTRASCSRSLTVGGEEEERRRRSVLRSA